MDRGGQFSLTRIHKLGELPGLCWAGGWGFGDNALTGRSARANRHQKTKQPPQRTSIHGPCVEICRIKCRHGASGWKPTIQLGRDTRTRTPIHTNTAVRSGSLNLQQAVIRSIPCNYQHLQAERCWYINHRSLSGSVPVCVDVCVNVFTDCKHNPGVGRSDFRTTTNGRAGRLLARTGSLTGHPSKQQPHSTLLNPDAPVMCVTKVRAKQKKRVCIVRVGLLPLPDHQKVRHAASPTATL
ncbi:hypothetical protein J6590_029190 [Homalodisca vitripennis]|nr:hypothetical protein J6590_029190 [Homalodisca vitripennis]